MAIIIHTTHRPITSRDISRNLPEELPKVRWLQAPIWLTESSARRLTNPIPATEGSFRVRRSAKREPYPLLPPIG